MTGTSLGPYKVLEQLGEGVAAALNHPHITVVHDIGHENETQYIVQECLEGAGLARVCCGDRADPRDRRRVADPVATAIRDFRDESS